MQTPPWLGKVVRGFVGSEFRTQMRQEQREALLDLLVLMMMADRHVALLEEGRIDALAQEFAWEGVQSLELFLDASATRARAAIPDVASRERYLDEIVARLVDPAARARAYQACEELATTDGELSPNESELLDRIARRLKA